MQQTYLNLATAYVNEAQARDRYTFYASIAKKEGFEQIAAIFTQTADQEKEHASNLYKLLKELNQKPENQGDINLNSISVPLTRGTTAENLQAAIDGELHEESTMYPQFADIAEQEGYPHIAARLRAIAQAEGHHADRYSKFLELIKKDQVFSRDQDVVWVCRECGYRHTGPSAPIKCPSCDHPQALFEVQCENF